MKYLDWQTVLSNYDQNKMLCDGYSCNECCVREYEYKLKKKGKDTICKKVVEVYRREVLKKIKEILK